MTETKHTPAFVSMLPVHDGDGYSWGGDIVVTFGGRSINLGSSHNSAKEREILSLAQMIAAAPDMLALLKVIESDSRWMSGEPLLNGIRAAIAKAEGR